MSRVLSTEEAKSAIQQIQSIVNGGLTDQISQLDAQGRTLSDLALTPDGGHGVMRLEVLPRSGQRIGSRTRRA
ncbi:hypothetical protein [Rathayibacter rathayi]|uniref:hypothetical protein n=1 Tax=Rathayibacter rathayi TaxID=33887 RepID=UPI0021586B07|nr:hypothetical protein [Rathayibacter rathayi]